MSEAKITMKLLIDTTKRKVLFAEASKECVDFLFHILSLPLGTVVGLLSKESMPGCIGSIYGSFQSLGSEYIQEGLNKDILLYPKPASGSASNVALMTIKPAVGNSTFYTCKRNCYNTSGYYSSMYVSDGPGAKCPKCQETLGQTLSYVASPEAEKMNKQSLLGYVKGLVTYMIMDDLCVKPMSTISTTAVLNKFDCKAGSLEEKEVTLDIKMGLALVKASLMSTTALTDVFLPKTAVLATID